MLIRTIPTTLFQIFCKIIPNSKVIIKSVINSDNNIWQPDEFSEIDQAKVLARRASVRHLDTQTLKNDPSGHANIFCSQFLMMSI